MDLGYGFIQGENRVTKQKVQYWLHTDEEIHWNAFLWYIIDYCDIVDYGPDWLIVYIVSRKQRQFFIQMQLGLMIVLSGIIFVLILKMIYGKTIRM